MVLPPNWRVAESIKQLQRQLRRLAPAAPATAFGTVADTAHTEKSQHYPKVYAGLGSRPVVCAGDFPRAGALNPRAVLDAIRLSRDPRVLYGISQGQQFSSYLAHGYPAWTWRPYTGDDGHFSHGHLSVVGDARADDPRPWQITSEGDDMLTEDQANLLAAMAYRIDAVTFGADSARGGPYTNEPMWLVRTVKALAAGQAVSAQREQDMLVAIAAIAQSGTSADTAAVLTRIDQRSADVTGHINALQQRVDELEAELEQRRRADQAAAAAEAAALDDE